MFQEGSGVAEVVATPPLISFKDQDEPVELAPVYLKYGMTLMRVAERNMEQAMNELMVKAMREQAGGGASGAEVKKLSQVVIEEQAAEHLEDLDEAWDALEMARLRYEGANDQTSACIARMALGDLCVITEDWEGADREFSACAEFRLKEYGDDRRTADAVFMSGLAKQMIPEKQQESLAQYVLARDIIARLVAKATASNDPELAELQSLLPDLEEKVANFGKDGDGEEDEDDEDDDHEGDNDAGMVEADEQGDSGKRALEEEDEAQQQQQAPSQDQAKKTKLDE